VSTQARTVASIAAVVVLGAAFGALLLDSTRTPSTQAPESAPSATSVANIPGGASTVAPSPAPVDPCPGVDQVELVYGLQTRFPAKTAADVLAWAPKDPYVRNSLEDMAGIRPGGPVYDPRVPRCRIDLLVLGQPAFARAYPQTTGNWLLPVKFGDITIATFSIGIDSVGIGTVTSIRGGANPSSSEATARAAGGTAADPVMAAELVYAAPPGCAPRDTVSWRLVRRSGTVVYLVPDYPGAPAPGALFRENEMRFMTVSSIPSKVGEFATAC
jgi:hypothetical protein